MVKNMNENIKSANPLGTQKESKLLVKFAIPCIISMLVTALYNIVDQIFIGQGIGINGNAATNITFPLSTTCTAISLLLGIGSATNVSLKLGAKEEEEAANYAGCGICLMTIFGLALFAFTSILLTPMLKFFGATAEVLPYAQEYTRIVAIGFPFLIANTGMSKLILADGSPRYSMISMLIGAIVNTILDPIFIFTLDMGMRGAALATILGQIVSFCISLRYMFHFKTIRLRRRCFRIRGNNFANIMRLGASACFNQIAMTVVQIVMNNVLSHYGASSVYGSNIPLACAGIITKVNMIFMSFVIGISQGIQPVIGFNYGAKKYNRVKKTYLLALATATFLSLIAFACFQLFPRQIIVSSEKEVSCTISLRTVFPDLYVLHLNQRHPACNCEFLQFHRQIAAWYFHVTDETDSLPAAAHRDLPDLHGNRRCHVCWSDCRCRSRCSLWCVYNQGITRAVAAEFTTNCINYKSRAWVFLQPMHGLFFIL